jgi:hypothetical protein
MRISTVLCASVLASLAACTVGDSTGDDDTTPVVGEVSGTISANQTWSGTVTVISDVTIAPGATVTVDAGTQLLAKQGTTVRVQGTLMVNGTVAAPVTMNPTTDATAWAGLVVDGGGAATIMYAHGAKVATLMYCHANAAACVLDHVTFSDMNKALQTEGTASILNSNLSKVQNGGVTSNNGDLTIRDSKLLTSTGDVIIQNGGAMTIEYSEIGEATGSYEHCDLHVNSATTLHINHSNVRAAVYGMMIGGTNGAVMQYNNFVENDANKDISEIGANTAVDLRFNYWDHGAPTALGAAYDVASPATARITDAGPRS